MLLRLHERSVTHPLLETSSVPVVCILLYVFHISGSVTMVLVLISIHITVIAVPVWVRSNHMTNVVPVTVIQLLCACWYVCYHGNLKTQPIIATLTSQQVTTTTPEHAAPKRMPMQSRAQCEMKVPMFITDGGGFDSGLPRRYRSLRWNPSLKRCLS